MQVGGHPDPEDCLQNWNRLLEHDLGFPSEEDRKIFDYLKTFYGQMSAPPEFALVREFFEKKDDINVSSRLDEIKATQHYIRTNFLSIVRSEHEQQQVKAFILACRDASAIAEHGRNLDKPINGKKTLRGVTDAVNYFYDKLSYFSRVETGDKLEGVVAEDADEVLEEYDQGERSNKFSGRNLFGLEPVDSVCRGHRSGEYWIHCAFASELKTTTAINYAYNNAYLFGKNIFYSIHEMPYRQLRRQLFVLHSSHGKFVTEWYAQDRKAGRPDPYMGLDYRKVRDFELDDLEKKRLHIVAQDFKSTCRGRIYIWRPAEENVKVEDVRRKAEMFHNKFGCDGVIIDYLGLLQPKYRSLDAVTRINDVVREGRLMALNFARGKTVPLLALFQLNRQGKIRADKADGRYDMAAIAMANQIEKDADVITYTYLNDSLRKEGKFYLGNLKNRDNMQFERMVGKILWKSKRMRHIESGLLDTETDAANLVRAGQHNLSPEMLIQ